MDSRTIFGLLGNLTAFILFLLPARTAHKVRRSPEERAAAQVRYSAYTNQYHAAVISCLLWAWYGVWYVDDSFLAVINSVGFIMQFFSLSLFVQNTRTHVDVVKHRIAVILEMSAVYFLLPRVALAFEHPANFAGTVCAAGSLSMCAVKMVYGTRRAPVSESAAFFANGAVWTVYALISSNIFILVPNMVWAVIGLVQLVIHCKSPQAGPIQIAGVSTTREQLRHIPDDIIGSWADLAQVIHNMVRDNTPQALIQLALELGIITPDELNELTLAQVQPEQMV